MNPTAQLLEPEIRELVSQQRFGELREVLHQIPAADVADIVAELPPEESALAFRFMARDDAADTFTYLAPEVQERLISRLGQEQSALVIEAMGADDRARLLDELPEEVAQRIVASLSPHERRVTQAILGYPERSVGRLMTPDYIRVRPEWTAGAALDHVRRNGRDAETINVVYVVDDQGKLIDDLRLRQILLAPPDQPISELMNRTFVALTADQDQQEAVQMLTRYDRVALPVLDRRGILLGIVTHDDVADVAQSIATEEMQKLGGMQALDEPYIKTGHVEMFKKRGFWLSALFVGQTFTIIVLGRFQHQLERAAVLCVFLPLVISCGGNSGSQAATLVTRALALGEIGVGDWLRIISRELVTAVMLAGALGGLGFVCVEFFTSIGHARTNFPMALATSVTASIIGVVVWGTVVGSLLPLALKKLRFDPATASSPMVATFMDASGTLIYLGTAVLLLSGKIL